MPVSGTPGNSPRLLACLTNAIASPPTTDDRITSGAADLILAIELDQSAVPSGA